jgi:hypothetical protein
VEDLEQFVEWLRKRGVPAAHIDAHRHYAMELAKYSSLPAAIVAEQQAGASAQRLANLRATSSKLDEFRTGISLEIVPEDLVRRPRNTSAPPPMSAPMASPAGADAARSSIDAPRPKSPTAGPVRREKETRPPRKGCECRERHDLYLDNDFGSLATMLGGGIGIGMIIMIRLVGLLGAFAVAFGLAGLGGLATILSICFRCEGCRRTVRDLDADERSDLRKGRMMVTVVTLALIAASALCGYLWFMAAKTRIHD